MDIFGKKKAWALEKEVAIERCKVTDACKIILEKGIEIDGLKQRLSEVTLRETEQMDRHKLEIDKYEDWLNSTKRHLAGSRSQTDEQIEKNRKMELRIKRNTCPKCKETPEYVYTVVCKGVESCVVANFYRPFTHDITQFVLNDAEVARFDGVDSIVKGREVKS